jgi:hypothetical protein
LIIHFVLRWCLPAASLPGLGARGTASGVRILASDGSYQYAEPNNKGYVMGQFHIDPNDHQTVEAGPFCHITMSIVAADYDSVTVYTQRDDGSEFDTKEISSDKSSAAVSPGYRATIENHSQEECWISYNIIRFD